MEPVIITAVDSILSFAQARERQIAALIRELVECESPSGDAAAVNRCVDLIAARLEGMGKIKTHPGGKFGKHLTCELALPGRKKSGQILALGHCDTVWDVGTLKTMPWREQDGKLWGPGVFDMKAGIAFFITAMQALRELDIPVPSKVLLQLNSDEEVGSDSSRALTEKNALRSKAVLVMEPSAGPTGLLKTARKGVGDYVVKVHGIATHAGLDFTGGASAILELARQIDRIAAFTDLKKGVTVSPGIVKGGTRSNVVAADAECLFDMRVAKARDAAGLDKKFRGLKPVDKRCTITVEGGMNRPPLERSAGVIGLFRLAQKLGRQLNVEIGETMVGGGSDGNFTAGLGIPTLDGIGAVGEGAHAINENIVVNRMADRVALLAGLVEAI